MLSKPNQSNNLGLNNLILSTKTRENAGSRTDERFNYQKDLSLFMMIEFFYEKEDYVFLFDFHDDLVVIDSCTEPKSIDFYQIKTKNKGNWTIDNLTSVDKGSNSYIGKLYSNKLNFGAFVGELCFISNARYNFKLNTGEGTNSKYEVHAKELNYSSINSTNQKIKAEFNLVDTPSFEDVTIFKVSKLSLADSKTHCKGALSEILEYINPGKSPNINLTYNKIFNEIRIKTDFIVEDHHITNFNDLLSKKGISKSDFIYLLKEINTYKSSEQEWIEIEEKLSYCQCGYVQITQLKLKFRELSILILNSPNNTPLINLIDYIGKVTSKILSSEVITNSIITLNFFQLMEYIYDSTRENLPYKHFDDLLVKSVILKKLNHE